MLRNKLRNQKLNMLNIVVNYRAFHGFGQARFDDGGSILGLSQFALLPRLPLKMVLDLKRSKLTQK